jgi:hypothetical protein
MLELEAASSKRAIPPRRGSRSTTSRRAIVYLEPFRIADRLVTAASGSRSWTTAATRPELWLSDGWYAVQEQRWCAPLYWRDDDRRLVGVHARAATVDP